MLSPIWVWRIVLSGFELELTLNSNPQTSNVHEKSLKQSEIQGCIYTSEEEENQNHRVVKSLHYSPLFIVQVYHSFHDEVDQYRQHIWQCDGPCRHRRPYFGLVKRSMNRAPGPRDPWWGRHQQSCGGSYTKIQEPEGYGVKKKKESSASELSVYKVESALLQLWLAALG